MAWRARRVVAVLVDLVWFGLQRFDTSVRLVFWLSPKIFSWVSKFVMGQMGSSISIFILDLAFPFLFRRKRGPIGQAYICSYCFSFFSPKHCSHCLLVLTFFCGTWYWLLLATGLTMFTIGLLANHAVWYISNPIPLLANTVVCFKNSDISMACCIRGNLTTRSSGARVGYNLE